MVDGHPEYVIPSTVDASVVLRSPDLLGCYGMRPIAQTQDHTCGAAATATILRWFKLHANEHQCIEALKTSKIEGTTWREIVTYLRRRGLKATAYGNFPASELIARARRGAPTLVEWMDWGGHWVVHAGYEPNMKALVFADPSRPRSNFACHSVDTFEKHWYAPPAKGIAGVPHVAITVDLWGTRKPLRPNEHYGTYMCGRLGHRIASDWAQLLMDWNTHPRLDWSHTHKKVRRTA